MENLAEFHPNRMADRILGMGDVVSMVEQVADKIDEKKAMSAAKRMQSGKFDFNDFLDQMKMIQSLGPLDGILGMLPGFRQIKKQLPTGALDDGRIKQMEAIVLSMTKRERTRPILIKATHRKRISRGSGTTILQVNQLLKQFGQMQKMMKSKGKMKDMMKQLGGMGGGDGGGMGGLGGMMGGMGGGKGGMPDMNDMGGLEDLLGGGKKKR
ncbi:MAG: signal recognition particle subunit SRP54 [Akkermansiaceae bacterium]|jgi:signal recognition particle subunit SRP54|tara:strand:+ start:2421 stop:3053 length:633 start_codon:yes stop_codon:yes gene_type:complete